LVLQNLVTPNLDLASRGTQIYKESRIELRNLHTSKKLLDKSSQFLSSEQPSEPKSLDVALYYLEAIQKEF